jgi:quercetin dioxygenase-like cupin family protein
MGAGVNVDLDALGAELLEKARAAGSGRAAATLEGGSGHALRQTVLALVAGAELGEHESPGEATLQVLRGEVELADVEGTAETLTAGRLASIPPRRHSLRAATDAVVLLTVVKQAVA